MKKDVSIVYTEPCHLPSNPHLPPFTLKPRTSPPCSLSSLLQLVAYEVQYQLLAHFAPLHEFDNMDHAMVCY